MIGVRARAAGGVAALILLVASVVASATIGATPVPLPHVVEVIGGAADDPIVTGRLDRTLVGLLVGAATSVAGAVLQGVTRNPLADPGLLGITSGAALAVVLGTSLGVLAGSAGQAGVTVLALAGGLGAAAIVHAVSARTPAHARPVTMLLAGAAVAAACVSLVSGIAIHDRAALEILRFWQIGSIGGRPVDLVPGTLPMLVVGLLLTLPGASTLNAFAVGDELAAALGTRVAAARALLTGGAVLLAAAATALAGPIAFTGLIVPHAVRRLVGRDHRAVLPACLLLGPAVLLAADTLGRVVMPPAEVSAGIMVALLGAPTLVILVRRVSS